MLELHWRGPRAGILYDGMVVLRGKEDVCQKIALNIPEATHVVYRGTIKWRVGISSLLYDTC